MPFPYKPRSGRVINGDEPELSSGREIRRRGCNLLHHHGATWQTITGHTKKGKSFDIFKDGVSLPGLVLIYLINSTDSEFY
jgi:hypothetical protein